MGRRRKDAKAPEKTSGSTLKTSIAVRKSTRQIAKKQQEEIKTNSNGDIDAGNNEDLSKPMEVKKQTRKYVKKKDRFNNEINTMDIKVDENKVKNEVETIESNNLDYKDIEKSQTLLSKSEIWEEDIIEETIICEEVMEVDGKEVGSFNEEEKMISEEVILVEQELLELNVDQNTEEGSDTDHKAKEIEEGVNNLLMEETKEKKESRKGKNAKKKTPKKELSRQEAIKAELLSVLRDDSSSSRDTIESNETDSSMKKSEPTLISKIDDQLAEMQIEEKNKVPEESSFKKTCLENDSNESSSLSSEKSDNVKTFEVSDLEKIECPNRILLKSRLTKETSRNPPNAEEICIDSEVEGKNESEDIKLSSENSSENSSDTLLSSNGCKIPDLEKNIAGQLNEGEKKGGFRSRSGSTDTTGSESGSNSSGVRRSSRIRTIGLMKQRSRGRGLVMKPSSEVPNKVTLQHQDREKLSSGATSSPPIVSDSKDNIESTPETHSDKENTLKKLPTLTETSIPSGPPTGYESDSSKPVKVKSRWRRSSELEMNSTSLNSTFKFCSTIATVSLNSTSTSSSTTTSSIESFGNQNESDTLDSLATAISSISSSVAVTPGTIPMPLSIPKTIGARISLPTVLEMKDREMEERLSQFEHLRENLYLTDRFTNKETKRMVCDCFLTEEEIERGELGCGEDCLNRLLMIECGSRCIVGNRCTNKRFQNCEYAKCEVFRTEKKGFGLRAVVDLYAGEFIMEYVGEVVDPKNFRKRAKEYSKDKNRHYYFMALKSDQIIDATMKGNISRFINHSCDPNSETQKWTVNGELRIGFFNKKFIAAGEEITFDYHFQRYGKEAQKCFCEALNCRGWIGDTPEKEEKLEADDDDDDDDDDEDEDEESEKEETDLGKEKVENKTEEEKRDDAKKKKESKKKEKIEHHMEDEDLEEEINKLCLTGLKNRAHTLTLSRLMVRSREMNHRTRLLKVIQSGEQPCRRLFLDYHGLRLIWSYMTDIATDNTTEANEFRLDILKTLITLPIPNKTMVMDSKVYGVVEKWAKRIFILSSSDLPDEDKKNNLDEQDSSSDSNEKNNQEISSIKKEDMEVEENDKDGSDKEKHKDLIVELAKNLLGSWANLKEVFRIPKKERIEQMKEHEREADRGYREDLEKEEHQRISYERHRLDRFGRNDSEKRLDRRRGRESPDSEYSRSKDKRMDDRGNTVCLPRLTKYERRQLFALKVAKEEEERQRRQQQESWQEHEARCLALGMDPHTTATMDPQTGYPLFFNPALGQWQHYPIQEGEIPQQCPPIYMGSQTIPTHTPPPGIIPPNVVPQIPPGEIPPGMPPPPTVVYSLNHGASTAPPPPAVSTAAYNQPPTSYPQLLPHRHPPQPPFPENPLPITLQPPPPVPIHNGTPPIPPPQIQQPQQPPPGIYLEKLEPAFSTVPGGNSLLGESLMTNSSNISCNNVVVAEESTPPQPDIPPIDLPPKWRGAKDARGRTYYYHVKDRISQWLPPPPDHIGVQPDTSSSSESSEESSSSNEDEDDLDEDLERKNLDDNMDTADPLLLEHSKLKKPEGSAPETKKRRDGLVQERIISPRREDDRVDHKKYKEIKEKIRRQRERAKLKEYIEKSRKHRRNKSKSHSRHNSNKLQVASDSSPTSERKIKDAFRVSMANVMVHFLNPYRKNDCKQGRITNTEDFKHLARKLTHFVLAKELKHCKSVDELQCNDNVKHKAKDFVRKYMSKFGAVYQKSTDED